LIQQNPTLRRVGFISFLIALLLGILLIVARAWPDLESTMYGFIKYGYPRLTSLSCPVLMTLPDRLPITIRILNPLDKPLSVYINAQFSSPVIIRNVEDRVELQPGETKTFSWEVGKENVDLHNFILARVFTSAATTSGMRESTCGTLVLKLPFKGGPMIFYASLVLVALAGGFGLWLWPRHSDWSDPAIVSQGWWMRFDAFVITVGVVAAIMNWWFLGILTLLLALLLSLGVFLIPRKI
jgi:hypothetical protein